MTKYIVRRWPFILGIFILECHLPLVRPSYTCPVVPRGGPPVRPAGGHIVNVGVSLTRGGGGHPAVCARRTDGCPGWGGGLLLWIWVVFHSFFRVSLARPNDYYHLFRLSTLGYIKLWYLLSKCLLTLLGHFFFVFFVFFLTFCWFIIFFDWFFFHFFFDFLITYFGFLHMGCIGGWGSRCTGCSCTCLYPAAAPTRAPNSNRFCTGMPGDCIAVLLSLPGTW